MTLPTSQLAAYRPLFRYGKEMCRIITIYCLYQFLNKSIIVEQFFIKVINHWILSYLKSFHYQDEYPESMGDHPVPTINEQKKSEIIINKLVNDFFSMEFLWNSVWHNNMKGHDSLIHLDP